MAVEEGVIKYKPLLVRGPPLDSNAIKELNLYRDVLYSHGLIGQDTNRYNNVAWGNVSKKLPPYETLKHHSHFIISGTQTGGLERLTEKDYTIVLTCYPEKNRVVYTGPKGSIEPSSEAMTHSELYYLDDFIGYVFHGHHKGIWENSQRLRIPTTKESVEYGTPEMAEEFQRVHRDNKIGARGGISMGGHEDGIVAFAATPQEAWEILQSYLDELPKIASPRHSSHSLIFHNS